MTIDRPDALNALDLEHNERLVEAWKEFQDDPNLWVAIITGAGERAFCAGADLKTLIPAQRHGGLPNWNFGGITRGFATWKPVIAAVNGLALAGGMELVLACDLRIASANAILGLTEVRWGLIPGAGGTQRLPRSIPLAVALQLILTGDPIDAHEAYRVGLVNKVVASAELMDESRRLADVLLSRGPLALRAAKRAVYEGLGQPLAQGMALELKLFDQVLDTEDAAEGPKAFAEKRAPVFEGK